MRRGKNLVDPFINFTEEQILENYRQIFFQCDKNPKINYLKMKTPPMDEKLYRKLKGHAWKLYHYLYNIIDSEGFCAPTNQNIQRQTGIVVVESQIEKLEILKLVKIMWVNEEYITDKYIRPYLYFLPCVFQ